jgi:hypothetical protein
MRALRVVGILENDGEFAVVLEDAERRERFTVPADERLQAAARGDLTRLGQNAIEVESQLRPREIQARIRAGASVEQVATMAGVPLQKIERFAYPVLLERSRTAEVAQRAHPVRAEGPDSRMLGDVVANTFGLRGQDYADVEWDSWKGEDGRWVVAMSWHAGHSDIQAHWTFQPGANGGTVTALDENAFDLVEGLPARPLRPVGPVIDMARPDDVDPGPAPVPELRAAASEGNRRGPEPSHPSYDRPSTRTAPEPRRPAPPAQRQAPAEPYQGYPAAPERPRERYSEPRYAERSYAEPRYREPRHPEPAHSEPRHDEPRYDGSDGPTGRSASTEAAPSRSDERRTDDRRTDDRRTDERPAERGPEPRRDDAPRPDDRRPDERPEPIAEAEPVAEPEPIAEPEPAAEAEPVAKPEPVAKADPVAKPEPVVEPEPVAKPVAEKAAPAEPAIPEPAPRPMSAPAAEVAEPEPPAADEVAAKEPEKAPAEAAEKAQEPEEAPARAAAAKPAARRTKKGKPVMPSWDEVLLGVRGRD